MLDQRAGRLGFTLPVLVVQQTLSLGQMLATMIRERWGCEVVLVQSLAEARSALAQHGGFSSAVCEVYLPDAAPSEGIEALVAAGVPVIAITTTLDEALRAVLEKHGVVDYVVTEGLGTYEYAAGLIGRIQRNRALEALVVHPDPHFQQSAGAMLRQQQLKVTGVATGEEALDVVVNNPSTRLLLVNHHLTDNDGPRFVQGLRHLQGSDRLVVIGVLGGSDAREGTRFLKSGASDLITAPFSYEELLCRVSHNLDLVEQLEAMRQAASFDFLTGLRNRRHFFDEGPALHRLAVVQGKPVLVAMLDLDQFKRINDTYGHQSGDDVLRHVASLLRSHFPQELVARLGGEEFGIMLTDESTELGAARLEHFRQALAASLEGDQASHPSITVSIGWTSRSAVDLDTMLARADEQLFRAKAGGRNRVEGDAGSSSVAVPGLSY